MVRTFRVTWFCLGAWTALTGRDVMDGCWRRRCLCLGWRRCNREFLRSVTRNLGRLSSACRPRLDQQIGNCPSSWCRNIISPQRCVLRHVCSEGALRSRPLLLAPLVTLANAQGRLLLRWQWEGRWVLEGSLGPGGLPVALARAPVQFSPLVHVVRAECWTPPIVTLKHLHETHAAM